jgi:hypothetical protein
MAIQKRPARKWMAVFAAALGAMLVLFEMRGGVAEASWFWVAVGAFLMLLGLVELIGIGDEP